MERPPAKSFRLLRFYTLATLGVFLVAGAVMYVLQRGEETFFAQVQSDQRAFFSAAQADLAQRSEAAARARLLAVHESAHVTLTRVVANLLWDSDIAPFVGRTQRLSADSCRALPRPPAGSPRSPGLVACHARLGEGIRALPGFAALDAKAYDAMLSTKVFKIKVWDLRGITVYSSEHAQIGEDGSGNEGWRQAIGGKPASELTHRARFSAFEGVVEDRDLISTYVPVIDDANGSVLGVVELYSDVTGFLEKIKANAKAFREITEANDARLHEAATNNEKAVVDSSNRFLLTVGGLLVLLYGASLLVVRIGQRIIDDQTLAQEEAARRELRWHGEKMAALSAMASNVAHEVGNPLAVIAGVAQLLPGEPVSGVGDDIPASRLILEQTDRIALMTRQLSEFASAESRRRLVVDINERLEAVCSFHGFDQRFRAMPVERELAPSLPACEIVPDHLNELVMTVLQGFAGRPGGPARAGRIVVRTAMRGKWLSIALRAYPTDGSASAGADPMEAARDAVAIQRLATLMGGTVAIAIDQVELLLPVVAPSEPDGSAGVAGVG